MNTFCEKAFGLKDRRAVITGAGRGIGRAMAEALAAMGAEVCIHYYTSQKKAQEVVETINANGGKAWAAGADLTDSAATKALFAKVQDRWGALDILVNNTGDLVQRSTTENFTDDLIDTVLKVNLHTTLYASREAIPLLKKGVKPSIINLSSVAAHMGGLNGAALYASTKGAIHTYTRGLAKELAPQIRVNGIAPGLTMTDFQRRHSSEELLEGVAQKTPLQRIGTAEEMAAAAVLLCGDGASFITGEVLEINGGLWVA
ncbi:SDR family oxidoreductase [candidate division KSB3 bacterium]|uniref:SDR family oxidoreductase n=1 Tax=candidate division KSB3 bacterium TaxID=2044937 RepID=A0A9D5Q758_9BACT|nr:SDR family oxidoreductase [candidate division KSB3 bacterium]MBD3326098.1 SDR family oxidoreductase [candidate division KSB3 bacterium]